MSLDQASYGAAAGRALFSNNATANPTYATMAARAASSAVLSQKTQMARTHFFGIPMLHGPGSEYSRSVTHWMHLILILQIITCILRLLVLQDFIGGIWTAGVAVLGWYAYKEDMNIAYVSAWGLVCLLNGVFDSLALALPMFFGVLSFDIFSTVVHICIPSVYFLGALFACHVYHLHAHEESSSVPDVLPGFDPLGKLFDGTDPEANWTSSGGGGGGGGGTGGRH
mmetsp:Transcript_97247/g.302471  ORF Transcript_97247/g.302471 Transcript_97247/m.302471 type:complete len:226 (-) Transcript_97247:50-727(-)